MQVNIILIDKKIDKTMFLPIKLICDRRPRRDGTNVISIQFCFSSARRTLLFKKTSCVSRDLPSYFGDAEKMNMELLRMLRVAEDIVHYAIQKKMEDPLVFLKQVFHPNIDLKTTQHYTKILDKKIGEDMRVLKVKYD